MAHFKNAIPASLRRQVESSQFAYSLMARSRRSAEETPAAESRFMPLPQEPEDAKITGLTRSLTRRLLGLNLPAARIARAGLPVAGAKVA